MFARRISWCCRTNIISRKNTLPNVLMKADVPRAVSARVFAPSTLLEYGVFQLQQVVSTRWKYQRIFIVVWIYTHKHYIIKYKIIFIKEKFSSLFEQTKKSNVIVSWIGRYFSYTEKKIIFFKKKLDKKTFICRIIEYLFILCIHCLQCEMKFLFYSDFTFLHSQAVLSISCK